MLSSGGCNPHYVCMYMELFPGGRLSLAGLRLP
jgi:hypothetical protein